MDIQLAALNAAGCTVIRSEKRSGSSTHGRAELRTLLDFIRKGDALASFASIGWRVASPTSPRSSESLREGRCPQCDKVFDRHESSAGRAFLQMLGVFAKVETAIRKERQLEGVAASKIAGV
jgi:DNA invertase Pin-like site-specific DNA recombinase